MFISGIEGKCWHYKLFRARSGIIIVTINLTLLEMFGDELMRRDSFPESIQTIMLTSIDMVGNIFATSVRWHHSLISLRPKQSSLKLEDYEVNAEE